MEAQPFPPLPARTRTSAWSANSATIGPSLCALGAWRGGPVSARPSKVLLTWPQCRPKSVQPCYSADGTGTMLTERRPRRVPNWTVPGTSANSVSSPPRPTPTPGWKCVPCWRTMISPAPTSWPPKRFTPRRWELESRPFRLEDAPFLCAISALLPRGGLRLAGAGLGGAGRAATGLAAAGLALADAGHPHLRVLLAVAEPAPVAGLVL